MNRSRRAVRLFGATAFALALGAPVAGAQAWHYPAFQTPTVSGREFNFAIAGAGDVGTSFLAQWRERMGPRTQITVDAGFAEPDGGDTYLVVGGTLGYQLARATRDMPVDLLFTAGLNAAMGDPLNFYRVPIGAVVGHRFPLEGRLAITPYIHPRVAIDFCEDDCFGGDASDISPVFDIGAEMEFSPQLAMRFAIALGGNDYFDEDNAIGLSLAWTPAAARRAPARR